MHQNQSALRTDISGTSCFDLLAAILCRPKVETNSCLGVSDDTALLEADVHKQIGEQHGQY